MRRILKPDGYLFLGTAETTLNIDDSYKRTPYGKTTYYHFLMLCKSVMCFVLHLSIVRPGLA